jgi:hypothetical protein
VHPARFRIILHVSGDIEEAWTALRTDESRQFFYFNDFLGESELEIASKNEPTNLGRFIERIMRLRRNKRFLMTTREQILGEAATSQYSTLQELAAKADRIGVRIDGYSSRARAEILFNHIYFSALPESERPRLAIDNRLVSIVEHPAYNPRMIRFGVEQASRRTAADTLQAIQRALDQPDQIWDTSFLSLPPTGRGMLLSLATLPSRPWPLETIRLLTGSSGALDWKPTLRILEPTWLRITGERSTRFVALANPGCRDYLLGRLDDQPVAEERVAGIRLLHQVVSLTSSAGLFADAPSPVRRPELAHVLMGQRDEVMAKIRGFVNTELASGNNPANGHVRVLSDTARLLAVYGREEDTVWLLDGVTRMIDMGMLKHASPAGIFMLAERLMALPSAVEESRPALADRLVLAGIAAAGTTHDLDGYEAMPQTLRTAVAQEAAQGMAGKVILTELEDLVSASFDADTIRSTATDLEQRANWYGLDIDIGRALDRANELAVMEVDQEPEATPTDAEEPRIMSNLFSRLAE